MTDRELWTFDQEPKLTLSTGEVVHTELWQCIGGDASAWRVLSIAADGALRIARAERLK